jgi:hypothetical protein
MPTDHRGRLATVKRFDQLIAYLRDEMGWPIARDSFEEVDDLFYDFTADELGIDPKTAAKIQEIKRLRPLSPKQPWGIFFVKFDPKKLPVVALRRILSQVALKKRASANSAERAAWAADDLLFVSNYGEGDERQISFAHFSGAQDGTDLPTLKVLGWDNLDTALHLDAVARELTEHLAWPKDDADAASWRARWRAAFTLRHREVVTTSKELSIRLAELARSIRDRITAALAIETDKGPLTRLMSEFQSALVHDLDADGFADMYAQTIAYGLLSARIADPHKKTADDFAAHMRTNPFLRELMETFLKVGGRRGKAGGPGIDFDELGVSEVVDLLDNANMEAVVHDFGDRNPQEDPVIHFYELFLKQYDARKRMQRGVFYTPRPVVSYIVRSVDELLRSAFGLADGLADTTTWGELARRHKDLKIPEGVSAEDDFVQILDPATGTGTFLVEVIELIHKTLVAKWTAQKRSANEIDALWNKYVPRHLLTRVHGYELLMAPYAIAHLKIGLKLYETGYRCGSDERSRVYLTNALEPEQHFSDRFEFAIPALAHEATAVNDVKRRQRFTVVIGNPPYSSSSQNREPWAMDLIDDYKTTVRTAETQIQALSDDYVKFMRYAQLCIETSTLGVVGFITNNTFQSATTFRDMRGRITEAFNAIHFIDLHGNSRLKETAVDGTPDENVFDILPGVCVSLLAATLSSNKVRSRADVLGPREAKYAWLSNHSISNTNKTSVNAAAPQYSFFDVEADLAHEYERGVYLPELFGTGDFQRDKTKRYGSGFKTQQDAFAICFTRNEIAKNVEYLLSPSTTESSLRAQFEMCSTEQWSFSVARSELQAIDWKSLLCPCVYRPFDVRFTVLHRGVVSNPRTIVMSQFLKPNIGLCVGRQGQALPGGWNIVFVTQHPEDQNLFYRGGNTNFPLYWYPEAAKLGLSSPVRHNLSSSFLVRLSKTLSLSLDGETGLPKAVTPEDIFHYVYAVLQSCGFRSRYAEFLKVDFPRLPLTNKLELFRTLARLGGELTQLHLLESSKLAQPITEFVGVRNVDVEKVSWSMNTVWIDKLKTTGFKGVGENVWKFHIGGYQVCEKWLKDRKGQTLSNDEIAHYQRIVVALSETIRLMKEIDDVVEQHGGWPRAFQSMHVKPDADRHGLLRVAEQREEYGSEAN